METRLELQEARSRSWLSAAASLFVLLVLASGLVGCRVDMHDQPKYEAYEASKIFADGTSAQNFPEGTVAQGTLREDKAFFEGYDENDQFLTTIPLQGDPKAMLVRGADQYEVFCTPCHGDLGEGDGMIVQRGFKKPESLHSDRLRNSADGYYFDVMTNGFGQMPRYAPQILPADRWAIVSYVRALQLSQSADLNALPASVRSDMQAAMKAQHAASADEDDVHGSGH